MKHKLSSESHALDEFSKYQSNLEAEMAKQRALQDWQNQVYKQQLQAANQNNGYSNSSYPSSSNPWVTPSSGFTPASQSTLSNMSNAQFAEIAKEPVKKARPISLDRAKDILLPLLKTDIVPFLWGPPGVGKSTLIKDICATKGWKLIDLRLSLLNPVDLRGLPVVDRSNQQADWYPPSFLPKFDDSSTGILFLDEINLAPLSVQAAAYQLILDKRVGEYRFPPHWRIIAAGNRETDRANVYKLSAPLANRFIHFTVEPNFETWKDWAINSGKIRKEIINFLILRPALLFRMPNDGEKAFPTPRTWAFLSDLMVAFEKQLGSIITSSALKDDFAQIIYGTIGEVVGQEFLAFLENTDLQKVTEKVNNFIKTGEIVLPKSTDERYAVITAIFSAYQSGKIRPKRFQRLYRKLTKEEQADLDEYTHGHPVTDDDI